MKYLEPTHKADSVGTPPASKSTRQGLYDPAFEHDACGIALVADMAGRRSHDVVAKGITALEHLAHRGASGAEEATGDGAGILIQLPHAFLRQSVAFELPGEGRYAAGLVFLPVEPEDRAKAQAQIESIAAEEGLDVLGWREVPTDSSDLGATAISGMPHFAMVFVTPAGETPEADPVGADRLCFCLRKRVENEVAGTYLPSLSCRTIVYKGMLTPEQLKKFFPELSDERLDSAVALVHSRFSTNTFPSWALAHPFRYVAHTGEITTVRGHRNWMRAREALLQSDLIPGNISRLFPICDPHGSDSSSFDEVLELLHLLGRSLQHSVLMMIPEAWESHSLMPKARRDFYRYHASLMEPWDGPAAVIFTDGEVAGGVLDRNGLRPMRYWVTDDGLVVLASEVGVLDIDPATVIKKGRLQPGRMFLVDMVEGRMVEDDEIKTELAGQRPYGQWLTQQG